KRDGGAAIGIPHTGAYALVVQVEAEVRLNTLAQRMQRLCLGGDESTRVAVYVDALRIAALEARGAVGVHDRQEMQGGVLTQVLHDRVPRVLAEEAEQVGDCHRRGALVAVHLRPEQHTRVAISPRHMSQRSALDAAANLLGMEAACCRCKWPGDVPPVLRRKCPVVQARYPDPC